MADLTSITVTIASGASLSTVANLGIKTLVGISLPANWTPVIAGLSFQVTPDGVNFQELIDGATGAALIVGAAAAGVPANSFITLDNDAQWSGINGLKVRSGTLGAPANQTNTVIVTLFMRTVAF
jgi:hypothetical protein